MKRIKIILSLLIISAMMTSIFAFAESKKGRKVTFNFVDVELLAVTKFISEITGRNFILDERIKGKISIIAPTQLSTDDAIRLFTSVLELKGFTVVGSGINAYKIVPLAEAKQHGIRVTSERTLLDESYLARLIPLTEISSDEALRFLRPVISKDGHIAEFGPGNTLLVVDKGSNVENILSIVETIDKPIGSDRAEMVKLNYASADAVAKILNDSFGKKTQTQVQTGGQLLKINAFAVADQRINAVILMGTEKDKEAMKLLIAVMDVKSPDAMGKINVYYLENADATELAKVLEDILKTAPSAKPVSSGAQPASVVSAFESGVSVIAEKATNSLVIISSPLDYQYISQVIKKLDKRRKQVFVESMIIEASIENLREIGTKWRAVAKSGNEPIAVGGFGKIDADAMSSIAYGLAGITVGGMGNFFNIPGTNLTVPGFAALFYLNEFKDAVNILSTPHILTADNKEAEIVVGENVPFITKREADPSRIASVFSSIERKDVGITLRITPQITEGDHVKLDIYKEISSVKEVPTEVVLSMGPTTTKRSTKTSVVVKDGQTVVIGGLMQEKGQDVFTKTPFLGDIPLIGELFKYKKITNKKTNLLIFLTPHVIKDEGNLAKIKTDREGDFARVATQYQEGELLIKFNEGLEHGRDLAIIAEKQASFISYNENTKTYLIRLKKNQDVQDAVKAFSSLPDVQSAEPNYIMKKP